MTGWRRGYSFSPRALLRLAERLVINSYSCPNAATQHAVHTTVDEFDARRAVVVDELNRVPGFRCIVDQARPSVQHAAANLLGAVAQIIVGERTERNE